MTRRRRTEEQVAETIAPVINANTIVNIDPNLLVPHEDNPRHNEQAIRPVMKSIENFGFWMPIVVNEDNVIIAGHTRREAALRLGLEEVPVVRATHLTEQQQEAFRVIDNKTAEMADWDTDKLAESMSRLTGGFDLTDFGWTQSQIDCLTDMVQDDCLADLDVDTVSSSTASTERVTPDRIRFVIGEIVIHIPASDYREWVTELRADCDFVDSQIEETVLRRLGVYE